MGWNVFGPVWNMRRRAIVILELLPVQKYCSLHCRFVINYEHLCTCRWPRFPYWTSEWLNATPAQIRLWIVSTFSGLFCWSDSGTYFELSQPLFQQNLFTFCEVCVLSLKVRDDNSHPTQLNQHDQVTNHEIKSGNGTPWNRSYPNNSDGIYKFYSFILPPEPS